MQESTLKAIETLATSDPDTSPEQVKAILAAAKRPETRRKLINAREAMKLLGISRPTLRRCVLQGHLREVKPTPRKTRFFLDEVERLAFCGKEA